MGHDASELSTWLRDAWSTNGSLSSPKLPLSASSSNPWYRYYAGYADAFVIDVVGRLPESTGLLLDPWNGAGTSTSVAAAHGIDARGFDINPAAVVIAKARLLQASLAPSLLPLTRKLLREIESDTDVSDDDMLLRWTTPRTALAVRRLSATIDGALIESEATNSPQRRASEMSPLAAVFYLALFRVVRQELAKFAGTNPTWLRQKVPEAEKIDVDLRTLKPSLLRAMSDLATTVQDRGLPAQRRGAADVRVADSGALPIGDSSVQAVITSPPYCTRIDYGVATAPELATLGMNSKDFRVLRDGLIGTPTRDGSFAIGERRWGETANRFMREVAGHDSHASAGYYLPFFSQYFVGMWGSLSEIGRVVEGGRPIVLVVQDSQYKDVHADIPGIMCEMASNLGWQQLARRDYHVKTRAKINPAARRYRATALATESVLAFSR